MIRFESADQTEHAFYQAFERLDFAIMGEVWLPDDRIWCIHPGGPLLQGRNAVLKSWAEIFTGASQPSIQFEPISVHETDELSVHLVKESIRPAKSQENPNTVLATNIYQKIPNGWRLLAHQGSLPLVSERKEKPEPVLH